MSEQEGELTCKVTIFYDPTRQIEAGKRRTFNCGYLFLQDIYTALGLPEICKGIQSRSKAEYDLDSILSRLIYGRVIEPSSKRATAQFARELTEGPSFDAHHIYRALSVLAENLKQIQKKVFDKSKRLLDRHLKTMYCDCTNYYFEISEEDSFKRYGPSKEHCPSQSVA